MENACPPTLTICHGNNYDWSRLVNFNTDTKWCADNRRRKRSREARIAGGVRPEETTSCSQTSTQTSRVVPPCWIAIPFTCSNPKITSSTVTDFVLTTAVRIETY